MTPKTTFAPLSGLGQASIHRRLAGLAVAAALLVGGYIRPIVDLVRYSFSSELSSYIPLIPFISLYLIWTKRRGLRLDSEPVRWRSLFPVAFGLLLLAAYILGVRSAWRPEIADYLALMVASLLSFLLGACFLFLGTATLRAVAFPAAFMIFAVPLPTLMNAAITRFLQLASADVAYGMFRISGTPIFRDNVDFQLPGFNLVVAPECSGIHSTLILFITGILAGHLFLRTPTRRVLFALAVILIALLRNGLRIFIVGQLCVHIGPEMIDSFIHRHGGPIFFVISLVPFYALLIWLQRSESGGPKAIATRQPT
jgi:exosortase C (VPDSG-CTERM-specific)